MASEMYQAGIEEQLECPICRERFRSPRQLPCQHIICSPCLEILITNSDDARLHCPECRAEHPIPETGLTSFPISVSVQRLIGALQGVMQGSTGNRWQANEEIGLQIAIEQSVAEEGRQENANTTFHSTNGAIQQEHTNQNVLQRGRKSIRLVLGRILNRHRTFLITIVVLYFAITISRFVAGAVKLKSDCSRERQVAVYLFVKAWFALFFWGVLGLWLINSTIARALRNPFVEGYLVIETLFSLIWLFLGTYWLMENFNELKVNCQDSIRDWDQGFIDFALILTVMDYIGIVVFFFYSGYTICEPEEVPSQPNQEG